MNNGREPKFEPRRPLQDLADFLTDLSHAVRSLSDLWASIRGLPVPSLKTIGPGVLGAVGVGLFVLTSNVDTIGLPLSLRAVGVGGFQIPLAIRAFRAIRRDSQRRQDLYRSEQEDSLYAARHRKAREWRRALCNSVVGRLPIALERLDSVAREMDAARREFLDQTGYDLTLVLIKRLARGRKYRITLTRGEVADDFKQGVTWQENDSNVYEYVRDRALYPHHLLERETISGEDYFLLALADIDLLGSGKQLVLDCFYEMVCSAIGQVIPVRVA